MRSVRFLGVAVLFAMQATCAGMTAAHAGEAPVKPGAIQRQQVMQAPVTATASRQQAPQAQETEVDLARKIGQMILVGFVGNDPGDPGYKTIRTQLEAGQIGGVLYLQRNLSNRATVQQMNAELTAAAPPHVPPLVAVDQEGGKVQRLESWHGFPPTLSAKRMVRAASPTEAATAYGVLAEGLSNWGFNLNLGPVVDLDVNPNNPIIGSLERAYSGKPETVAEYGIAFVDAHRDHGVLTTLKHFPGHGSSRTDSHKGAVDVSATWSEVELEPFRQLIARDRADLVMTAHVVNRALKGAGENLPVSLSAFAQSDVLRGDLGYDGVIISDDLQMDAIRRNFPLEDAVVRAVGAGTDILVFANDKHPDPEIPERVASILLEAAKKDPLLIKKIESSYERVLALKSRLNAQPIAKPDVPSAAEPAVADATGPEQRVLTPEDVDASIRSVRLVLPTGLAL